MYYIYVSKEKYVDEIYQKKSLSLNFAPLQAFYDAFMSFLFL